MTEEERTHSSNPVATPAAERLVQFAVKSGVFHRLPRHPDWRYELWDGGFAHLSHHPEPVRLVRSTAVASPGFDVEHCAYDVRTLMARPDLDTVAEFLATIWRDEDPYRSFEHPDAQVRADLSQDITRADLTFAAYRGTHIVGAVLLAQDRGSAALILSWLAVAPAFREQAVATALLEAALADLASRDMPTLMSACSPANPASLRWHLSRGFMLEPRSHG